MGIISKLKSVLGVADDRSEGSGDGETPIPVEREPVAAGERAVKGVDTGGSASDGDATSARSGTDASGKPVESIKGIGPAYARRLEEAGVHSVADLAAADPDDLAAATDLGAGRIENWVERARART